MGPDPGLDHLHERHRGRPEGRDAHAPELPVEPVRGQPFAPLTSDDRFLSVLPLYRALEFTCGFLAPLYRGCTVSYARSLKPKVILEMMRETGTTVMLGVPTLYALLRDDIERRILGASRSQLRSNLMETGKRIARSWERTFDRSIGRQVFLQVQGAGWTPTVPGERWLGARGGSLRDLSRDGDLDLRGYGLTETAPVLTVNPLYQSRRGSCGKPVPGVELRLFHTDKDGVGEIIVRTPSLMKGLLGESRGDRAGHGRRLVPHRRSGLGGRRRIPLHHGPHQGRDRDGRGQERLSNGPRGDLSRDSRDRGDLRSRGAERPYRGRARGRGSFRGGPRHRPSEDVRKRILREIQRVGRDLPSYHRLQQLHLWPDELRDEDGEIDRPALRRAVRLQVEGQAAVERAPARDGDRRQAVVDEIARLARMSAADIQRDNRLNEDLGLDSLQAIELLLFLDHSLGVSLDDETAARIQTVGQLLDEVRERMAGPAPARRARATVRSRFHHERPPSTARCSARSASDKALYRGTSTSRC